MLHQQPCFLYINHSYRERKAGKHHVFGGSHCCQGSVLDKIHRASPTVSCLVELMTAGVWWRFPAKMRTLVNLLFTSYAAQDTVRTSLTAKYSHLVVDLPRNVFGPSLSRTGWSSLIFKCRWHKFGIYSRVPAITYLLFVKDTIGFFLTSTN